MRLKASECTTKGNHVKCRKCGAVVPDWCGDEDKPLEAPIETPVVSKRARKTK